MTVKKFNVGDKVICRQAAGALQYGHTYFVYRRSDVVDDEVFVQREDGHRVFGSWLESRFELDTTREQQHAKPPLGLKPRKFAVQERLVEVLQAMTRYVEAGKKIPDEWDKEYAELYDYLRNA